MSRKGIHEPFLSDPNAPKPSKLAFLKHFLLSLAIVAGVIFCSTGIYKVIPHPPHNALAGAKACMNRPAQEAEWAKLVQSDFKNLDNHRGYLLAHFSIPKTRHTSDGTVTRDDDAILKQYNGYSLSPDPQTRDIGFYGLGYFYVILKQADKALSYFTQVSDKTMPYLNISIGNLYLVQKNRPDLARGYLEKEIALKGFTQGAVSNLALLYWQANKMKELGDLIHDPALGPHVPHSYRRYWDLREGNVFDYLMILAESESDAVSPVSLLASLVIALMFLVYVYYVDVFEKEKLSLLLSIFAMGILSAVLVTVFYDLAGCFWGFTLTGDDVHDFWFYLFGVGLFEETVKALPVLVAAYFWKKWDEPVDLFIFAAVSALGFACLENAGYFSRYAISLIVGRTLSAVVLHVCLTSLAVYGFFYQRYKKSPARFLAIPLCFGAAVAAHGFYDFFASSSLNLGLLSILVLVLMMLAFRNMVETGLDLAEFRAPGPFKLNLSLYLFYGLLGILLMQFAILDIQYGPGLTFGNLGHNLLQYYFLFVVLITDFGNLKIVKGKWRSLLDRNKT
jgi:RsiW-degrading membrane proteinase PrsW (M82 family)